MAINLNSNPNVNKKSLNFKLGVKIKWLEIRFRGLLVILNKFTTLNRKKIKGEFEESWIFQVSPELELQNQNKKQTHQSDEFVVVG